MRVALLLLLGLLAVPGHAAKPTAKTPLLVLCHQRLLRYAPFALAEAGDPELERFRQGALLLRRLEKEGGKSAGEWDKVRFFLNDVLLAVEADAVLDGVLEQLGPHHPQSANLIEIQQTARRAVLAAFNVIKRFFPADLPALITDPTEAQKLGVALFESIPHLTLPAAEREFYLGVTRLAQSRIGPPMQQALALLMAIHGACSLQNLEQPTAVLSSVISRVFMALLQENGEADGYAWGLLRYASGGDARSFLFDVDAFREGQTHGAVWLMMLHRQDAMREIAPPQLLSDARLSELDALAKGEANPNQFAVDLLETYADSSPLVADDGVVLVRKSGPTEKKIRLLIMALHHDLRMDEEADRALSNVLVLVGDPRVDAEGLLDWVQSLFGERASFRPDQFTRFLQEANAVLPIVRSLGSESRVVISREHRKFSDEELGPSFDLWVVHNPTGEVRAVVEIKQTSRPKLGSDIGGIVRQATSKLDGKWVPPLDTGLRFRFEDGTPSLRGLKARRVLVIQIPWSAQPTTYEKAGLTFVQYPDGSVERRRGGLNGAVLGTESIFEQIALHLPKVTDSDYFDEIRLTDYAGRPLQSFSRSAASR